MVNLYPFEATVAKAGCTLEDAIENIDIGGPAMVRSAAKNWKDVAVLTDASQYATVIAELKANGQVSRKTKFALSVAAFNRISQYDGAISDYLSAVQVGEDAPADAEAPSSTCSPARAMAASSRCRTCATARTATRAPRCTATCIPPRLAGHGQAAAGQGTLELQQHRRRRCRLGVREELQHPRLRHRQARQPLRRGRGCQCAGGLQQGVPDRPDQRLRRHHRPELRAGRSRGAADFQAVRRSADGAQLHPGALEVFKSKVNVRILQIDLPKGGASAPPGTRAQRHGHEAHRLRHPAADGDNHELTLADLKVVTTKQPTQDELNDLLFAWNVAKFVKSNAIVFCKNGMTMGVAPVR